MAKRNYVREDSLKVFHGRNESFQPQAVNFKAESELCGKLIGTSSILDALVSGWNMIMPQPMIMKTSTGKNHYVLSIQLFKPLIGVNYLKQWHLLNILLFIGW